MKKCSVNIYKLLLLLFIFFLIMIVHTEVRADTGGEDWKTYIGREDYVRNYDGSADGGLEGTSMATCFIKANPKNKEEAEALVVLIDAFFTAPPGTNETTGWYSKVGGGSDNVLFYETNLNEARNRAQKMADTPSGGADIDGDGEYEDFEWSTLDESEVGSISTVDEALNMYRALVETELDPPYTRNRNLLNKYVRLLVALKNSTGMKNVQGTAEKNAINERLKDIYHENSKFLNDEERELIEKNTDHLNITDDGSQEVRDDKIYVQPNIVDVGDAGSSLEDMMDDADSFVSKGNEDNAINNTELADLSSVIYNIVLQVGIAVATLIGVILGIKFMLESAEGKAEVKKMLLVYVIGCIVVFGAFGIWKLVVTLIEQI